MAVGTTYDSALQLALARLPRVARQDDPILYEELLDIHNAIEQLANQDVGGDSAVSDYFMEVAAGRVAGSSVLQKFGENPNIPNAVGTFVSIWDVGGAYVPPTQARVHSIVSTSAQDIGTLLSSGTVTTAGTSVLIDSAATFITDGVGAGDFIMNATNIMIGYVTGVTSETELAVAGGYLDPWDFSPITDGIVLGDTYGVVTSAGTGAYVVLVQGLDGSGIQQEEFVYLNGAGIRNTLKSYKRLFRARSFGGGANNATVGNVTFTATTDLTVSAQITSGYNQTLMAIYTVPANKNAYLWEWWGSLSKKVAANSTLILRAGTLDGYGYVQQLRTLNTNGSSEFDYDPKTPTKYGPGTDIWVEADSDTNATGVSSGFDLILEDIV